MMPDINQHKPDPTYLRSLLNQAELSQEEFATKIGVTSRTVRSWASNGGMTYPAQFMLEVIAANQLRKKQAELQEALKKIDAQVDSLPKLF